MIETPTPLLAADRHQSVAAIEAELRSTLPWLWAPAFRIGSNEGYDGRQFGARTGPVEAKSSCNVLHEVAHAVELTLLPSRIWKRRVRQPSFEMRVRSYQEIAGRRYYEPRTMQPTERECRTGGIQLRLLEAGGYATDTFTQEFALTLRFMSDWYFGGSCPVRPYAVDEFNAEERQWVQTRKDLVQQAYDKFSLADIQDRWDTVMQWLKKAPQPV